MNRVERRRRDREAAEKACPAQLNTCRGAVTFRVLKGDSVEMVESGHKHYQEYKRRSRRDRNTGGRHGGSLPCTETGSAKRKRLKATRRNQ